MLFLCRVTSGVHTLVFFWTKTNSHVHYFVCIPLYRINIGDYYNPSVSHRSPTHESPFLAILPTYMPISRFEPILEYFLGPIDPSLGYTSRSMQAPLLMPDVRVVVISNHYNNCTRVSVLNITSTLSYFD